MSTNVKKYSTRPLSLSFKYSYTNNTNDTVYDGIVSFSEDGVVLFDNKTGLGGIGSIPTVGDTITFTIEKSNKSPFYDDFNTSWGNGVYVYVSESKVKNAYDIITNGTLIPLTLSGFYYTGTYTFTNPDDFNFLYFLYDFDNKTSSTSPVTLGGSKRFFNVKWLLENKKGLVDLDINCSSSKVCRVVLFNNDVKISDTGFIGLNSIANYNLLKSIGVSDDDITLSFPYNGLVNNGNGPLSVLIDDNIIGNEINIAVDLPLESTTLTLTPQSTSLTSFYMDAKQYNITNVCANSKADTLYYHNGTSALPDIGNLIYTDANGLVPLSRGSLYSAISTTVQSTFPGAAGIFVQVDSRGAIISKSNLCACNEVAIPVINQGDIDLIEGSNINLYIDVTNKPFSWNIVSTYNTYSLSGGTRGAIYTYTDKYGASKRVSVSVNTTSTVVSSASPVIVTGTGTVTNLGPTSDAMMPEGVTFGNGIISGTPNKTGVYPITLNATNCVGVSANKSFVITVAPNIRLTPFLMDKYNFASTNTNACAVIAPNTDLYYHDGVLSYPSKGDTIYADCKGLTKFIGGGKWYRMDLNVIQIDADGVVIDTYTC